VLDFNKHNKLFPGERLSLIRQCLCAKRVLFVNENLFCANSQQFAKRKRKAYKLGLLIRHYEI
jgi:hypothetical protein